MSYTEIKQMMREKYLIEGTFMLASKTKTGKMACLNRFTGYWQCIFDMISMVLDPKEVFELADNYSELYEKLFKKLEK